MAKKEQQKGNGKGHQKKGSGGGRVGSVAENIKNTEGGRSIRRNENKLRDRHQMEERDRGVFHARVNEGRSNDLVAAIIRGEPGSYAWPGGNEPSLHFSVGKEIRRHDTVQAVRFEAVQKGHELEGCVFDPKVWVNAADILKHGENFKSRAPDRLMAATQELICQYMALKLEEAFVPEENESEAETPSSAHLRLATSNLGGIADEVAGFYLFEENERKVVVEVFHAKSKVNLKVVYSEVPELTACGAFVPVHLLSAETLDQITPDHVYAQQCAIHAFVKPKLASWKKENETVKAVDVPLTASGKPMGAKELAKQQRKAAEAALAARKEADRKAALQAMRARAMSVTTAAMTGKIGYVDFSGNQGDLIVQHRESGGDKIVEVAFIGDNHILRLAGVDVGTKVFHGQIMAGKIDASDHGVNKLTKEEIHAKTSFIGFVRGKLEEAHIRLPARQPANLKLAA